MSDIQTQIKEAAKWRGITAPMLMDAMHLTNWSYALRLITGRQDMRISTLEKLAAVLGYEVQLVRKQSRGGPLPEGWTRISKDGAARAAVTLRKKLEAVPPWQAQ